jgi:small conductance mechanosensitive channel
VDEQQRELVDIGDQLQGAKGEDAKALRERGREVLTAISDDLEDLVANVRARQDEGIDAADDRARVAQLLGWSSGLLQDFIVRFFDRLTELRGQREEASVEELDAIQKETENASELYGAALGLLLDQTLLMGEFGLTTDEQRAFLGDHLERRAELVAGRLMLARDDLKSASRLASVDPTNTEVAAEFDRAKQNLDLYAERLETTTRMMDALDLDTADYRQMLFEATGEITTDLLDREVVGGLVSSWTKKTEDWIRTHGPSLLFKALVFVLILVVFRVLSRVARGLVHRAFAASTIQASQLLERTVLSVTGTVVMLFGLLVALSQVGVEVTPLLAGLGVAGFIVGFALQDTLGNFASGVMILLYRPYDVGDLVETGGHMGKVKDMTLVSTTILTVDNQTLVIPNSKIWGDVIKNVTAQTRRRVDMVFGIGYADDIEHAERVLKEIVAAHDKVLEEPEAVIKVHSLGESSVDFVVRPWVATDDYWDVYWDITREVKLRFDAEGISIPFPQRDVHLFSEPGRDKD